MMIPCPVKDKPITELSLPEAVAERDYWDERIRNSSPVPLGRFSPNLQMLRDKCQRRIDELNRSH